MIFIISNFVLFLGKYLLYIFEHVLFLVRASVTLNHHGILKVKENQRNVSIVCTGMSYPTPQVTWKKNNQSLPKIGNDSTVYQLLKTFAKDSKTDEPIQVTSTLFLRPAGINYEDYGTYTCEVLNRNESTIPLRKMINVLCKLIINMYTTNSFLPSFLLSFLLSFLSTCMHSFFTASLPS